MCEYLASYRRIIKDFRKFPLFKICYILGNKTYSYNKNTKFIEAK